MVFYTKLGVEVEPNNVQLRASSVSAFSFVLYKNNEYFITTDFSPRNLPLILIITMGTQGYHDYNTKYEYVETL